MTLVSYRHPPRTNGYGDVYQPVSAADTYDVGAGDSPLPSLYRRLPFPTVDTGDVEPEAPPLPPPQAAPPRPAPYVATPPAAATSRFGGRSRWIRYAFVGVLGALALATLFGLRGLLLPARETVPTPRPTIRAAILPPTRPPPIATPRPSATAGAVQAGPTGAPALATAIARQSPTPTTAAAGAVPTAGPPITPPPGAIQGGPAPVQLPSVVPTRAASAHGPAPGPARGYFTLGSTTDELVAIQGKPDTASETQWSYSTAYVTLLRGKVVGWSNVGGKLKVQLEPAGASTAGVATVGSTMDEVASIHGTPDYLSPVQWTYDAAYLTFQGGRVNGWSNVGGKLRLSLPNAGQNASGSFAVGVTTDEVAGVQGVPEYLGADRWVYGGSSVDFIGGRVVGWANAGDNLRVRLDAGATPARTAGGIASYFTLMAWLPARPAVDRVVVPMANVTRPTVGAVSLPGAVDVARTQLGRPYVWGGASPATSFDCSGLVQWAFGQLGVALPRTAQQQYDVTAPVATGQLRPGDLLFYANTYPSHEWVTHVGIYAGSGRMLNATAVGGNVAETPIFGGSLGAHYVGAGRVRSP